MKTSVERSVRAVCWALGAFPAERRALFGQSMGGLTAILAARAFAPPVDRLMLYEPMAIRALNPGDPADTREREWDRALVRAVSDAVGTDGYEAATAAFIEAWNDVAWADMPAPLRENILSDAVGLVAEMKAVNDTTLAQRDLKSLAVPTLLLGGDRSPALASRILDQLERHLPDTQRFRMSDLGHMGPVTASSTVADKLIKFLA